MVVYVYPVIRTLSLPRQTEKPADFLRVFPGGGVIPSEMINHADAHGLPSKVSCVSRPKMLIQVLDCYEN